MPDHSNYIRAASLGKVQQAGGSVSVTKDEPSASKPSIFMGLDHLECFGIPDTSQESCSRKRKKLESNERFESCHKKCKLSSDLDVSQYEDVERSQKYNKPVNQDFKNRILSLGLEFSIQKRQILMKANKDVPLSQYTNRHIEEVVHHVINEKIPVSILAKRLNLNDFVILKWVSDKCHYYGEQKLRRRRKYIDHDSVSKMKHRQVIDVDECVRRYVRFLFLDEKGNFKRLLIETGQQLVIAKVLVSKPIDGFERAYGIDRKEFLDYLIQNLPPQVSGMSLPKAINSLLCVKNEKYNKENARRDRRRVNEIPFNVDNYQKPADRKLMSALLIQQRRDKRSLSHLVPGLARASENVRRSDRRVDGNQVNKDRKLLSALLSKQRRH